MRWRERDGGPNRQDESGVMRQQYENACRDHGDVGNDIRPGGQSGGTHVDFALTEVPQQAQRGPRSSCDPAYAQVLQRLVKPLVWCTPSRKMLAREAVRARYSTYPR